jgi:hypothetical protein
MSSVYFVEHGGVGGDRGRGQKEGARSHGGVCARVADYCEVFLDGGLDMVTGGETGERRNKKDIRRASGPVSARAVTGKMVG